MILEFLPEIYISYQYAYPDILDQTQRLTPFIDATEHSAKRLMKTKKSSRYLFPFISAEARIGTPEIKIKNKMADHYTTTTTLIIFDV